MATLKEEATEYWKKEAEIPDNAVFVLELSKEERRLLLDALYDYSDNADAGGFEPEVWDIHTKVENAERKE